MQIQKMMIRYFIVEKATFVVLFSGLCEQVQGLLVGVSSVQNCCVCVCRIVYN